VEGNDQGEAYTAILRGGLLGTVNLAGWPRLRGRARVINRVG
jgi:hypothetical protein